MIGRQHEVASLNELLAALADPNVRSIAVTTDVFEAPGFRLSSGQTLSGDRRNIRFAAGHDGVQLSADNELSGLCLIADPQRRAVFNDTSVEQLGVMRLRDLRLRGCMRLL